MSEKEEELEISLTGKQRKTLRALGHHLEPIVYVGKEGLSDNLIASAANALKAHELIKVKLGQNCPLGKKEAADELARQTGAALVQVIGKMVLLYLANTKLPADQRIHL